MSAPNPTLGESQSLLGDWLRREPSLGEKPEADKARVRSVVAGNERLSPEEQADIYREQFWLRHRDSLREDFPALLHFLGQDAFDRLARAYLTAHPPSSWTLRDLPLGLPDFVRLQGGLPAEQRAAALDLCRYELGFITVFDAADAPAADPAALTSIAPDAWSGARLRLHPALVLLSCAHAVHEFRAAVRDGAPIALRAEAADLALWRGGDLRVNYAVLEPGELQLLGALGTGDRLGPACEAASLALALADRETFGERLGRWFSAWGRRGWIVGVEA